MPLLLTFAAFVLFLNCLPKSSSVGYSLQSLENARNASLNFYGNFCQPCLLQDDLDYSRKLAIRFGTEMKLMKHEFNQLLHSLCARMQDIGQSSSIRCMQDQTLQVVMHGRLVNCSVVVKEECMSLDEVYENYAEETGLMPSLLPAAIQKAIYQLTNPVCFEDQTRNHRSKPSLAQTWGYGLAFVTLVLFISNIGGFLAPFMPHRYFQLLLQFLVAMGAGTLLATGILVLIPEAVDITSHEELADSYMWKATVAMFSIYVLFVFERLIKLLLKGKELRLESRMRQTSHTPSNLNCHDKAPALDGQDLDGTWSNQDESCLTSPDILFDHGHSHFSGMVASHAHGKPVAIVAWMVMVGDAIHNFVDGMAIGAAFTESNFLGISIGIAVVCEELPHELGDISILLHSGMGMKRALFINFLSACVCYLGLIVGIVLGEKVAATRWILAMAGGLFLYVPLVDMLPDLSNQLDLQLAEAKKLLKGHLLKTVWLAFLCQSIGLLLGMCIILSVVNIAGIVMENFA